MTHKDQMLTDIQMHVPAHRGLSEHEVNHYSQVESSLGGLCLDDKKEAVAKWLGSINMGQYSPSLIRYG